MEATVEERQSLVVSSLAFVQSEQLHLIQANDQRPMTRVHTSSSNAGTSDMKFSAGPLRESEHRLIG
jgi:hypothetical protein